MILLIGVLFLSISPGGLAGEQIKVIIDGEKLNSDTNPVFEDGRLLIPIRAVAEAMDFQIHWNNEEQIINILKDNTTISLSIDSNIAYINNNAVEIDIPARIINNRTFVPIRLVSETLGTEIEWYEEKRMILIKDKQRYFDQVLMHLRESNLSEARINALLAPFHSTIPPTPMISTNIAKTIYYFPEGEAFYFYVQEGCKISYIEAINSVFTKTWEANIGGQPLQGAKSTLSKYFASNSKGYVDEMGLRPLVTKPLVFFEFDPKNNLINYGRINTYGIKEQLGATDHDSNYRIPIVDIPEEVFAVENFLLPSPPADYAYLFASQIPRIELSKIEKEELEREWEDNNYYSYNEMFEIQRNFIDLPLYIVYSTYKLGLPQSSDPQENILFKKEYEYYLSFFTDEVKNSSSWADFMAIEPITGGNPTFQILQAQSIENRITATIIGNRFAGFWILPFLMDIEMEKEGDKWLFTSIDNIKVYETMQEMQKNDPEMYYLLVKIYNFRKDQGMQL